MISTLMLAEVQTAIDEQEKLLYLLWHKDCLAPCEEP